MVDMETILVEIEKNGRFPWKLFFLLGVNVIVQTQIVSKLLKLGAYLQREGGRITRQYGLSQQHFVVLKTIQELGCVSQKEIRSELLYEKSNISKAVSSLEHMKLICTHRSEEDGRIMFSEVTIEGERVIEACMKEFDSWNKEWLQDIPEQKLKEVSSLLQIFGRG